MTTPYSIIVLAGGQGLRMGVPKTWLRVGGRTLLEDAVARLQPAAVEVLVAAPEGVALPETSARRVFDRVTGLGPLAGLEAGLSAMSTEVGVAVAVDLPNVDPAITDRLAASVQAHQAAIARSGGRVHPTCGAYARACLPTISEFLHTDQRRMTELLERLDVVYLDDLEVTKLDNLNHPADYRRFLRARSGPRR